MKRAIFCGLLAALALSVPARAEGSFNDLPSMRGNHDYIFGFLKSVCYAFGHLYGKREGISPAALMEECLHDVEQAAYHPHKAVSYTHLDVYKRQQRNCNLAAMDVDSWRRVADALGIPTGEPLAPVLELSLIHI